ncbi:MAG: DUF3168 domain-containing protein [Phycisphaerales bacterium]|nr:DUF3168 domain-containing protein [Hyphomonadaceae bacterium]
MRAALLEDDAVAALLGARVYDDPPADVVFPYLTLGRLESRPAEASEADAVEHAVTLHVWSRYGGRAEALDLVAAARAAVHNAALDVDGLRLVLLRVQFTDVFRSGDGRTTHGVLRLRAVTETE